MNTTSSTTCPAHKGSLKPQQLTGYLAGVVGTAALLGAPQAEATVTAVTFDFGSVLSSSSFPASAYGYSQAVLSGNGSTFGALAAVADHGNIGLGSSGSGGAIYAVTRLNSYGYLAFPLLPALLQNTTIGTGANTSGNTLTRGYFNGFNSDQSNKVIGFKTSTGNWGGANVSWNNTAQALTINSAYVESTPNSPISVAAVPEPSRALLVLAGLGGVALRRRRKQAV